MPGGGKNDPGKLLNPTLIDKRHRLRYTLRRMDKPSELLSFTLWPSLYATSSPQGATETWADVVRRMSVHRVVSDKLGAPGFGPYTLLHASRKDASVEAMTLAVFDVDQGTKEDVERCEQALQEFGARRLWYSSHSHSANKPALRLVLPFSVPLDPRLWPYVRADLLSEFHIPAAPDKCSTPSHFYFLPSKPTADAPAVFASGEGDPLNTEGWLNLIPEAVKASALARELGTPTDWVYIPPVDPTGDLKVYADDIKKRIATLRQRAAISNDSTSRARAELLERLLNGLPLAGPQERNLALRSVTHALIYALPSTATLEEVLHFVKPSLAAMRGEGSQIQEKDAERLILGAMRLRAYHTQELHKEGQARADKRAEADAKIPNLPITVLT